MPFFRSKENLDSDDGDVDLQSTEVGEDDLDSGDDRIDRVNMDIPPPPQDG